MSVNSSSVIARLIFGFFEVASLWNSICRRLILLSRINSSVDCDFPILRLLSFFGDEGGAKLLDLPWSSLRGVMLLLRVATICHRECEDGKILGR